MGTVIRDKAVERMGREKIERDRLFQKAKKLIEALAEDCTVSQFGEHNWRECRRCLATVELESKEARVLVKEVYRRIQNM
jgi:hypothetical protein